MDADFELDESGLAQLVGKHGGRRAGAGRPKGTGNNKAMAALAAAAEENPDVLDEDPDGRMTLAVRKARAVVMKEEALAELKALELKVETGKYLPREAFQEATATVLATVSQALRSLPDMLERQHNLPPEVLQVVENTIDEVLNQAADSLALFAAQPNE